MKGLNKKIYILGAIIIILVVVIIFFLVQSIQKSSQELVSQKKEFFLAKQTEKGLENLREQYTIHQQNLEKFDNFFVDSTLPIEFIRFLEKSALDSQSSIKVSLAKELTEPEPALLFNISFSGSFPNLLKFIDKLENGPYLVEISDLNVRKNNQEPLNNIMSNLELIALTK